MNKNYSYMIYVCNSPLSKTLVLGGGVYMFEFSRILRVEYFKQYITAILINDKPNRCS